MYNYFVEYEITFKGKVSDHEYEMKSTVPLEIEDIRQRIIEERKQGHRTQPGEQVEINHVTERPKTNN